MPNKRGIYIDLTKLLQPELLALLKQCYKHFDLNKIDKREKWKMKNESFKNKHFHRTNEAKKHPCFPNKGEIYIGKTIEYCWEYMEIVSPHSNHALTLPKQWDILYATKLTNI